MPDITAKVRAKGLEATGVTEEIANHLFAQVGKHYMAVVEFKVEEPHGPNAEGKRRVDLILTQFEPAMDTQLDTHLRNLTRTTYYNRATGGQPTLEGIGTDEPTVQQVLAAGAQFESHPFLPVDASEVNPICDVCGVVEGENPAHAAAAQGDSAEQGEGGTDGQAPDGEAASSEDPDAEPGAHDGPGEPIVAEDWDAGYPEGHPDAAPGETAALDTDASGQQPSPFQPPQPQLPEGATISRG